MFFCPGAIQQNLDGGWGGDQVGKPAKVCTTMVGYAASPEAKEESKKDPEKMEESTKKPEAPPFIRGGVHGKRSGTLYLVGRGNERTKCSSWWKLVARVYRSFLPIIAAVLATVLMFFIARDRRPQGEH